MAKGDIVLINFRFTDLSGALAKGLLGRLSAVEVTELNTKLKVMFQLL